MPSAVRTLVLTGAALLGFATNSLMCRFALRTGSIDAVTFTSARLVAGALVLAAIARASGATGRAGGWTPALALFGYALAFSVAYLRLPAGVGALVLFAAVQATMIAGGIRAG